MIKSYLASFALLFLMTCDKEGEILDCAAVSCLAQTVSIEFIDDSGNNLIANDTYALNTIEVFKGQDQLNDYQESQETTVRFFLSGNEGENTYTITLDEVETDVLILNLNQTSSGSDCCSPIFEIESATYNGENIEVNTENDSPKITVVKSQD